MPIEYLDATFEAGPMGLRARGRVERVDWAFGNTLVNDLVDSGAGSDSQARRAGVRPRDTIVAINGEYVAFLSHDALLSRLKATTERPLVLTFARPDFEACRAACADPDAVLKAGELDKLPTGFSRLAYGRWQEREFVLTKTTISYMEGGLLKRKIGLDDVVRVQPYPASGVSPNERDCAFAFVTLEREFVVKASSPKEKLAWMHAIECALNKAFSVANPEVLFASPVAAGTTPTRPARKPSSGGGVGASAGGPPPPPPPAVGAPPPPPPSGGARSGPHAGSLQAIHSMGAGRLSTEVLAEAAAATSPRAPHQSSFRQPQTSMSRAAMRAAQAVHETGPYWMLATCAVRIVDPASQPVRNGSTPGNGNGNEGGDDDESPPDLTLPPPPGPPPIVSYDFSVENKVMERVGADP